MNERADRVEQDGANVRKGHARLNCPGSVEQNKPNLAAWRSRMSKTKGEMFAGVTVALAFAALWTTEWITRRRTRRAEA